MPVLTQPRASSFVASRDGNRSVTSGVVPGGSGMVVAVGVSSGDAGAMGLVPVLAVLREK